MSDFCCNKNIILNRDDVLDKFYNMNLNKNELFNLYINSPFCINQCNYCRHKGKQIKINGDLYKDFFENYLPNMIEFYSPVLEKYIPNAVYFGGGSSSIMTEKIMEDIFNKIPNFEKIKSKTFEFDINLLSKEKKQLLLDYGFTRVSFGIQTLNKNILLKNNRLNQNIEKIQETIEFFQQHNIFVNCDLMVFIDNEDESDFNQLIIDLKKVTHSLKPNRITVYPNSFTIDKLIENNNKERAVELISNLQHVLFKNLPSFNNYFIDNTTIEQIKSKEKEKYLYYNYLFFKSKEDEKLSYNGYNASSYPNNLENYIVLGIGSFEKHKTYSYIRKDYYFHENNINNDYEKTCYSLIKE